MYLAGAEPAIRQWYRLFIRGLGVDDERHLECFGTAGLLFWSQPLGSKVILVSLLGTPRDGLECPISTHIIDHILDFKIPIYEDPMQMSFR